MKQTKKTKCQLLGEELQVAHMTHPVSNALCPAGYCVLKLHTHRLQHGSIVSERKRPITD